MNAGVQSPITVTSVQSPLTVSLMSQPTTLVVSVNRGEKGDKGDKGSNGNNGVAPYTHTQSTLSTAWAINHSLNRYVSITVYRQDGLKVDGTVINNGPNVSTITFALAINGVAYCI